MKLKHRYVLGDIANALHVQTAVEIGTHQGVFASEFIRRFRGKIYLVDPYSGYEDGSSQFHPCFEERTINREQDYLIAARALDEACNLAPRYEFIRSTSDEASKRFSDSTVGLVYIDGLHDYQSVLNDIRLWLPKVYSGGVISGHDFCEQQPGVVQAVRESFGDSVMVIEDEMPSWWVQKQ